MPGEVTITPPDLSSDIGTTPLEVHGYTSAFDVILLGSQEAQEEGKGSSLLALFL
jgi:hypothetical protein